MSSNEENKGTVKPLPKLTEKHEKPVYMPKNYSRDSEHRTDLSEKNIRNKE